MSISTARARVSHQCISLDPGDGVGPLDGETTHMRCMRSVGPLNASEIIYCERKEKQEAGHGALFHAGEKLDAGHFPILFCCCKVGEPHGALFHPGEKLDAEHFLALSCCKRSFNSLAGKQVHEQANGDEVCGFVKSFTRNIGLSQLAVDGFSDHDLETTAQEDTAISASKLHDAGAKQRKRSSGLRCGNVARPSSSMPDACSPEFAQRLRDAFEIRGSSGDVEEMITVIKSQGGSGAATVFNTILRSEPNIELALDSWSCLFKANQRSSEILDLMAICKASLQYPENWDDSEGKPTNRVSLPKALSQYPMELLQIFQMYDVYDGPRKRLPPSSPRVLRLCYLIALQRFLEDHEGTPINPSITRLCFPWSIIETMFRSGRPISLGDCTFLYCAATDCIVQSPLFEGHSWMASESLVTHFGIVMEMRRFAIAYSRETYQSHLESEITSMTFFERLACIVSPVPPVDIPWLNLPSPNQTVDNTFVSRIRKEIFCCWTTSLQSDVVAAYVAFHDTHLLEEPQYDSQDFMDLAVAFIDGLSRFCSRHSGVIAFIKGLLWPGSPEEFDWISCVRHLHLPDCLLSACQILSRRGQDVTQLARMDPDNMAWESCRERLREDCDGWCSEAREASRSQLDAFFVKYQRERHRLLTRISGRVMDWWCGIDTPSDMV